MVAKWPIFISRRHFDFGENLKKKHFLERIFSEIWLIIRDEYINIAEIKIGKVYIPSVGF